MTHIIPARTVFDSIVDGLPIPTMCGEVIAPVAFPEVASDICHPCTVATNEAQRRAL
jgi:hypothetical protein